MTCTHRRGVKTYNDEQRDKLDQMLRAAHDTSEISSVTTVRSAGGWVSNGTTSVIMITHLERLCVEQHIRCEALLEQVSVAFESWRVLYLLSLRGGAL